MITGFERLILSNAYGTDDGNVDALTLDLANLGFTNWVKTAGTVFGTGPNAGTNDTLTLNKMASGGTVVLTAQGLITVGVTDAATGTADVLNVVVNNADNGSADSKATGLTAGTLTAANVETINLTTNSLPELSMRTITIDNQTYDLDQLPVEAKQQLEMLGLADQRLRELQRDIALVQTARNAYAQALKSLLPTPTEQAMQSETLKFN